MKKSILLNSKLVLGAVAATTVLYSNIEVAKAETIDETSETQESQSVTTDNTIETQESNSEATPNDSSDKVLPKEQSNQNPENVSNTEKSLSENQLNNNHDTDIDTTSARQPANNIAETDENNELNQDYQPHNFEVNESAKEVAAHINQNSQIQNQTSQINMETEVSETASVNQVVESDYPELIVSEIMPDTTGADEFEYFEVTNITDRRIPLGERYRFTYGYTNSSDVSSDVPLEVQGAQEIIFDPKESIVFWLSYTANNLDSFSRTVEEFKQEFNMSNNDKVYRITGQPGMANGGNRTVRIYKDDELDSWSYYEPGHVGANQSVSFRLPQDASYRSMDVFETLIEGGNPGSVSPEQLVPNDAHQEEDIQIPQSQNASPLIVTELLVDTENSNGSDAYEFIEIANVSNHPIDFSHFTINYLYPVDFYENNNEILWPAQPSDIVIEPGKTLTFWIKNGNNNHLQVDDFNQKFNTNLVMGQDLTEIYIGGMANGSPRGIQIQTNTGEVVNRAYYNMESREVVYEQSFKYQSDDPDLLLQSLVETTNPTPGELEDYQIPVNTYTFENDAIKPVIENLSQADFDRTEAYDLIFNISDNQLLTTVTLSIVTSADSEATVYSLTDQGEGKFVHRIETPDLTGKDWISYEVRALDMFNNEQFLSGSAEANSVNQSPVNFNIENGTWINQPTEIIATGSQNSDVIVIDINGERVITHPALADNPVFAFEATSTDMYFLNGVIVDGDILHIFDEGTYSEVETISVAIPQDYRQEDNTLTVSIYAGTKAITGIDPNENNDDFEVKGMRLILPDGRTLRPRGYNNPEEYIYMGDSAGKHDFIDLVFDIPDDAYQGNRYILDPSDYRDGTYIISANNGQGEEQTIQLQVDTTGPEIFTSIEDGFVLKGGFILSANSYDSGVGLSEQVMYLDGSLIENDYLSSSAELDAGNHILEIIAVDTLGNESRKIINFVTPEENPSSNLHLSEDDTIVLGESLELSAVVEDPTNDQLDVYFKLGERINSESEKLRINLGTVNDAIDIERGQSLDLTPKQISKLANRDGNQLIVESDEAFPYQIFEIELGNQNPESQLRFHWSGEADGRAQVRLYVYNPTTVEWDELDAHLTNNLMSDETEAFELNGLIDINQYQNDSGVIQFLVQHSVGYAGPMYSDRSSQIEVNHPDDEPRSEYDFTFVWQSDTQYYNEQYVQHQESIHDFIIAQRDNMNIQYVIHSGDIIDDYDQIYQWENATKEYQRLDDAGIPYGVLAGNHDVGNMNNDFSNYSKYFGENRFSDNPWYIESHKDNRGHYDLLSVGGIDFLILHMSWEPGPEEIDWMNKVLSEHPERVAILNNHEFLQTTGGLGVYPRIIMEEVVATNPNVRVVLSGHYHDAHTRLDEFDDDGDGVIDRVVTSMLFDYQGLPEGGQGFLRLLHFDNVNEVVKVRTYSESLQTYNSEDPSLLGPDEETKYIYQDFDLPYSQLGIVPEGRILATDYINIEVLSNHTIGDLIGIDSPSTVNVELSNLESGTYDWFIHVTDAYGGEYNSPIQRVTFEKVESIDFTDTDDDLGGNGETENGEKSNQTQDSETKEELISTIIEQLYSNDHHSITDEQLFVEQLALIPTDKLDSENQLVTKNSSSSNHSLNHADTADGETLPNTNTGIFNILLAGIGFIFSSLGLSKFRTKKD